MAGKNSKIRFLSKTQRSTEPTGLLQEAEDKEMPRADSKVNEAEPVEARLQLFNNRLREFPPANYRIVLRQSAFETICDHLGADVSREHGGLLLGRELQFNGAGPPVVIVDRAIPAQHTRGDCVSLEFTVQTWLDFERQTDELERQGLSLLRVGWYHSHPNINIFLSHKDLDVCTNFTRANALALVVDPVRHLGGFFVKGSGGFTSNLQSPFWVFKDGNEKLLRPWQNLTEVEKPWQGPFGDMLERSFNFGSPTEDRKALSSPPVAQPPATLPAVARKPNPFFSQPVLAASLGKVRSVSTTSLLLGLMLLLSVTLNIILVTQTQGAYKALEQGIQSHTQKIEKLIASTNELKSKVAQQAADFSSHISQSAKEAVSQEPETPAAPVEQQPPGRRYGDMTPGRIWQPPPVVRPQSAAPPLANTPLTGPGGAPPPARTEASPNKNNSAGAAANPAANPQAPATPAPHPPANNSAASPKPEEEKKEKTKSNTTNKNQAAEKRDPSANN